MSVRLDNRLRRALIATQTQPFVPCPTDKRVLSMDVMSPKGDLLICGVQHRTLGRYGLHVYRLSPNRQALPRTFEFPPPDAS